MQKRELQLIQELMEELQGKMEHSEEDFNERLGRKPEAMAIEVEGEMPMGEEEMPDPMPMSMEGEMDMEDEEEESPESSLKRRLMKLRE